MTKSIICPHCGEKVKPEKLNGVLVVCPKCHKKV